MNGEKRGALSKLSVVGWIVLVTCAFSFLVFLSMAFSFDVLPYVALQPDAFLHGKYLWTLATHMLVHGNGFHLLVNMFFLVSLGRFCEQLIGQKRFFWLYVISGLIAGLVFVAFAALGSTAGWTRVLGDVHTPGVGASGALFGILGVLAMLIPRKHVFLLAGPLIFILVDFIIVPLLPHMLVGIAHVVLSILIFLSLFALFLPGKLWNTLAVPVAMPLWIAPIVALAPLIFLSFFFDLPFGNGAHLGGVVVGIVYGGYLRTKYRAKIRAIERFFR